MAYLATIAAFGFPDADPPNVLAAYHRLGCRASQFYRMLSNAPDLDEARRIAEDAGVPFDSMHGVFGPEYDPSSPDETIRRDAVEAYRREGDIARRIGGPRVVVHPAPGADSDNPVTEQTLAARVGPMRKSMEELADIGRQLDVVYLIENIPANFKFGFVPAQLAEMISEIDDPHLRMCVDTGHAHMTAGTLATIDACADVIDYLHVSDNDTMMDDHRVPGYGTIDWPPLGRRIDERLPADTPAMLELFIGVDEINKHIEDGLGERLKQWLALD